ncbi:hypothetical protein MSPP1_002789 [Malassezia sp. CBS 17886]|nr:hypothetical protein MSPP1_002789 [Malassezia sp. CBS 17886]
MRVVCYGMDCAGESTAADAHPADTPPHAHVSGDAENLYRYIYRNQVWGLNVHPPEAAKAPVKPWDERDSLDACAESGVDDQLIITVPFTCPVRIQSILLNPGRGDTAPRRCAAFVNRPHGIDFDEAEAELAAAHIPGAPPAARPQADFALLPGAHGATAYPVSVSRFAHTNSVSLLLGDSLTQDTSRIYYIGFVGKALVLQQEATNPNDVAAANASHTVDNVRGSIGASSTPSVR